MDWLPTLSEWQGPVFMRIVDALAADIASGRLVRGQQIPTHRALAGALDIDLTTVTRAYGEARRRGLLEAQVGRGTFVSETTARAAGDIPFQVKIDLSMNLPPQSDPSYGIQCRREHNYFRRAGVRAVRSLKNLMPGKNP